MIKENRRSIFHSLHAGNLPERLPPLWSAEQVVTLLTFYVGTIRATAVPALAHTNAAGHPSALPDVAPSERNHEQ